MFPVTITLSPGLILSFPNLKFSTLIPIPEVLINIPSPCPFSTTLVSPVTISTPAIFAVSLKDSIILFKFSTLNPSSIINPKLRYLGMLPHINRSLQVPHTASFPISPPTKKRGLITKLSVEKAISPFKLKLAPSPSIFNLLLPTLGNITFFIKFSLCSPPLP